MSVNIFSIQKWRAVLTKQRLVFADDWDEANDVVRRLMADDTTTIDEILEAMRKESRPRRTCIPSQKALESAALPSEHSDVCTDFDEFY